MESKKRKPLADITNTYNLRPVSALRDLVIASSNRNSRLNPSIPILKSGSSSSNQKPCSDSSNRSVPSIGSSSYVNSARTSGTVRIQNPTRTIASTTNLGGLRNKDVAANVKQAAEKDKKEEKAYAPIDSLSHIEKRKDKGKAIAPSFTSWLPKTKADFPVSRSTPVEKRKDKEKAVAVPFSSSVPGKKADTVVADSTLSEKTIDKGKAVAVPFSSSVPMKKADTLVADQTLSEKRIDKGKAVAETFDLLAAEEEDDVLIFDPAAAEKRQEKGKAVVCDLLVPGKNANDLSFYQTPVDKRKDKGKAVDVPYSLPLKDKDKGKAIAGSSMLKAMNDDQNGTHCRYSPLKEKMQHDQLGLWPVGGDSVDMIEDFGINNLRTYSVSREKAKIRKSVINSASSSMGTEGVTEKCEGTNGPSASSVVKENEIQKEIILPPSEKEREKGKHVNLVNSLKKTRNKGKESSATMTVSRRRRRVNTERGKNVAGASSCPPPRKTRNMQNDLDEAGDDESLKSWTDPRPKPRKKRRTWSGSTDGEYEKFFKQNEDYFKQQQAYFKEIDDYELIVEEASHEESE